MRPVGRTHLHAAVTPTHAQSMVVALERYKYKQSWLASAVKENDIGRGVHLLELGIRPTNDESLVDDARLALWEYLACNKESDLVRVRPLRRWAMLRHWVRMRGIFFYWQHLAAMPGSKTAERAAKRFEASAEVLGTYTG